MRLEEKIRKTVSEELDPDLLKYLDITIINSIRDVIHNTSDSYFNDEISTEELPEYISLLTDSYLKKPLFKQELVDLFLEAKSGNFYARKQLISNSLDIAFHYAISYSLQSGLQFQDVFSDAILMMFEFIDHCDKNCINIREKLKAYFAIELTSTDYSTGPNTSILSDNCLSIEELQEKEVEIGYCNKYGLYEAEEALYDRLKQEYIQKCIDKLNPMEQLIIRLRFGFEDGIPHTLEEIGQLTHRTCERIRQIEKKSINRLRYLIRKKDLYL